MSKAVDGGKGSRIATVERGVEGVIRVAGCLDVHSVARCRDEGVAFMADADARIVFDVSDSEARGSAVIALLIAWQREARLQDVGMSVTGATDALLGIAEACGVRDIIPFES